MSGVYDNWEKLVAATFRREELRQIALCPSFSSSMSSDFSFDSSCKDVSASSSLSNPSYRGLRSMTYKEIRKATENFRKGLLLDEGAFGTIYKGWIREDTPAAAKRFIFMATSKSGIAVAIKKWKPNHILGSETWMSEFKYLSQLDHPNVVELIGYCSEGDNLALVFELMSKGSLSNYLVTRGHPVFPWDTRIKVAIDAARGLCFLHDREIPVIHGDFNSDKILLDVDFNAKLCGFCLATDGTVGDTSSVSNRGIGTFRLIAPEYLDTGHLTTKCDVYAFGVVLLRILSGSCFSDMRLVKLYMNGMIELSQIMDPELNGNYPQTEAIAVLSLAFQCLNSDPELRPHMNEVLVALQRH